MQRQWHGKQSYQYGQTPFKNNTDMAHYDNISNGGVSSKYRTVDNKTYS